MSLLRPTQQQLLFSIVQQMGFSRDDFELIQRACLIDSKRSVHALKHKATGFFFSFDYMRLTRPQGVIVECVTYAPSPYSSDPISVAVENTVVGIGLVERWLADLKRETEALASSGFTQQPTYSRQNALRSTSSVSKTPQTERHPVVFISYSHDSAEDVHALANKLREDGIDVNIDRYEPHPPQGWMNWMIQQIHESDFVLCVCNATYKERFENQTPSEEGKGARFEGSVITQAIYDKACENKKFIPVLFAGGLSDNIPVVLRPVTHYRLPTEFTKLYCVLTGQDFYEKTPLGELKKITPISPAGQQGLEGTRDAERPKETESGSNDLATAPRFILNFRRVGAGWERLSFLNDGSRPAINIRVVEFVHNEHGRDGTQREVHTVLMTPDAIPVIPPTSTGEGQILVEESPGHGGWLRDILRKGTPQSIDTLTIAFEDGARQRFEQSFELTLQNDDSIRFDPGPVRLREADAKPKTKAPQSIGPILAFIAPSKVELNRYGLEVLYTLAVDNIQRDVYSTARNTRARVEYTYANEVDKFTVDPVGWIIDEHQPDFGVHVDLSSGDRAKVIVAIATSDGPRVTDFTETSCNPGRTLAYGRWDMTAQVTADNCASITIRASFRIGKDGTVSDFQTSQA